MIFADEAQDSGDSGKSSGDERLSPVGEAGDKGARKRKAGLKLNQIAARLQEKHSPGAEDDEEEATEVKREVC